MRYISDCAAALVCAALTVFLKPTSAEQVCKKKEPTIAAASVALIQISYSLAPSGERSSGKSAGRRREGQASGSPLRVGR